MEADKNLGEGSTRPRRPSFHRFIKALSPVPYLIKAWDYYITSMTECAGRADYCAMVSGTSAPFMSLPESFSTNSYRNEEDFRQLVRIASQKSGLSRSTSIAEGSVVILKPQPLRDRSLRRNFSTSSTPMVGRIDEERPCYFPASFRKTVMEDGVHFLRSRSCNHIQNSQAQMRVAAYKK